MVDVLGTATDGAFFCSLFLYRISERSVRTNHLTQEVDNADLLVAAIGMDDEELRLVLEDVKGEPLALDSLGQGLGGGTDGHQHGEGEGQGGRERRERLKKLYKITEDELAINSLEECILMRMAVKDH